MTSKPSSLMSISCSGPCCSPEAAAAKAKRDLVHFSQFICSSTFYLLKRWEWVYQPHPLASTLFYRLLSTTCQIIPLPIVLLALNYVDRIHKTGRQLTAQGSEPHLFAIALLVAQKTSDDFHYSNASWAKIMGLTPSFVSKMERDFLHCIDYKLNMSQEEYVHWFYYIQTLAKEWDSYRRRALVPQPSKKTTTLKRPRSTLPITPSISTRPSKKRQLDSRVIPPVQHVMTPISPISPSFPSHYCLPAV